MTNQENRIASFWAPIGGLLGTFMIMGGAVYAFGGKISVIEEQMKALAATSFQISEAQKELSDSQTDSLIRIVAIESNRFTAERGNDLEQKIAENRAEIMATNERTKEIPPQWLREDVTVIKAQIREFDKTIDEVLEEVRRNTRMIFENSTKIQNMDNKQ